MKLCDLPTARDLKSLGYDGEYSAWIDTKDESILRDKIKKGNKK